VVAESKVVLSEADNSSWLIAWDGVWSRRSGWSGDWGFWSDDSWRADWLGDNWLLIPNWCLLNWGLNWRLDRGLSLDRSWSLDWGLDGRLNWRLNWVGWLWGYWELDDWSTVSVSWSEDWRWGSRTFWLRLNDDWSRSRGTAVSFWRSVSLSNNVITWSRKVNVLPSWSSASVANVGLEDLWTLAEGRDIRVGTADGDWRAAHIHLPVSDLVEPRPGKDRLSRWSIGWNGVWQSVWSLDLIALSANWTSSLERLDDSKARAGGWSHIVSEGNLARSTAMRGATVSGQDNLTRLSWCNGQLTLKVVVWSHAREVDSRWLERLDVIGSSLEGLGEVHRDVGEGSREKSSDGCEADGELHFCGSCFREIDFAS